MKKYCYCLWLIFFVSMPAAVFPQQKKLTTVNYGDNAKAGKYISIRGIKMYYETYGTGKPLLLIHGNGGSIAHFKYQIPFFAKHYKVIAADSRAQGKTIDMGDSLNYEMMTDDLNALLEALHIDSAYVIGWSDGGINGLLLAIRHPDKVKKLAVTGANLSPGPEAIDLAGNQFIEEYKSKLLADKQDAQTKNAIKLLHMMEVEPNISVSSLQKIKCPVLVMGGDFDVIKPSHTLQIFENIPQAYLYIFPASGHATLQRYKDAFNKNVQDFFMHPYKKINWMDWDE